MTRPPAWFRKDREGQGPIILALWGREWALVAFMAAAVRLATDTKRMPWDEAMFWVANAATMTRLEIWEGMVGRRDLNFTREDFR